MIKIFQYKETFQGNSCFSGQAQVAQNSLMIKKYIFNTVNSGHTLFFGQAQVAQNPE